MMDLILWRHAEAHDAQEGEDDLLRTLTTRGEKQAARMAVWLDRQLPQGLRVLASPARRTEQTAQALGRKFKMRAELLPDSNPADLLELVRWPDGRGAVLVVGHQPMLGQTAAQLLGMQGHECTLRKGAVWWLRRRERLGVQQTVLLAALSPEFLLPDTEGAARHNRCAIAAALPTAVYYYFNSYQRLPNKRKRPKLP